MNIQNKIQAHIKALKPYSSARSIFIGQDAQLLDANEWPFESAYNRYPDPMQRSLKAALAELYSCNEEQLLLGNGSDELLDLVMRIFCSPGSGSVLSCPPTYGMYQVISSVQNLTMVEVPQTSTFELDLFGIFDKLDQVDLVVLCSPNNPTGKAISLPQIKDLLRTGVPVLVDEAYAEFSEKESCISLVNEFPNLMVSRTLSKFYGMAGLRIGALIAHPEVLDWLNRIKMPYNISQANIDAALKILGSIDAEERYRIINYERKYLTEELSRLPFVEQVFPSEANFLLVRFKDASSVFRFLKDHNIITRDRSQEMHCHQCLRISVGTEQQNQQLMTTLKSFSNE
jgi:histidinol-phosphate aminotransferase